MLERFKRHQNLVIGAILVGCWAIQFFSSLSQASKRLDTMIGSFQWLLLALVLFGTPRAPAPVRLLLVVLSIACGLIGVLW